MKNYYIKLFDVAFDNKLKQNKLGAIMLIYLTI